MKRFQLVRTFQDYPNGRGQLPKPIRSMVKEAQQIKTINRFAHLNIGLCWRTNRAMLFGGYFYDPGDERLTYEIR